MKPAEITVGETYRGRNGVLRTVTGYGAHEDWIMWARTADRLPLGGFVNKHCTSRKGFAAWALERIPPSPGKPT